MVFAVEVWSHSTSQERERERERERDSCNAHVQAKTVEDNCPGTNNLTVHKSVLLSLESIEAKAVLLPPSSGMWTAAMWRKRRLPQSDLCLCKG